MQAFSITLEGSSPLLMHNVRLADPLDPVAKALKKISSKRNKTEDDHQAMAELEFIGGLYIIEDADNKIGPYVPGQNIWKCMHEAAKLNRLGTRIERGMSIETTENPLHYKGPRDAKSLWDSGNFHHRASVVVSGKRIQRTRPMFRAWSVQAEGMLDESQLDLDQLGQIAENAGRFVGLCEARKLGFGRFVAKVEESK